MYFKDAKYYGYYIIYKYMSVQIYVRANLRFYTRVFIDDGESWHSPFHSSLHFVSVLGFRCTHRAVFANVDLCRNSRVDVRRECDMYVLLMVL